MMPGRVGIGLAMAPPGREEFSSETVVAVLVTYWSAVRGPTHSMIFLEQRTVMSQDELDFLGRFALLSAVAHDEKVGTCFTALQELDVGVTSVLFQAMCPATKLDVQYCLSVAVRDECIDRYVSLSAAVNERLAIVVEKLTSIIGRNPGVGDAVVAESASHVKSLLSHLDIWMEAVVPPCNSIADTLFGNEDNVTKAEKDFLSAAITAHCTCHQRSLIVSSSPTTIDKWIRTLCLISTPEVMQCSLLFSSQFNEEKKKKKKRKADGGNHVVGRGLEETNSTRTLPQQDGSVEALSPKSSFEEQGAEAHTPGSLPTFTPLDAADTAKAGQGEDAEGNGGSGAASGVLRGYTPDIFLQGLLAGAMDISKSDVALSRYPPCVVDVDAMVIMWPTTSYHTDASGKAEIETDLRAVEHSKPAQCVRAFVHEVFKMDRALRGGYAKEWRRLSLRRAAAVVAFVDAHIQPDALDGTFNLGDVTSNGSLASGAGADIASPRQGGGQNVQAPEYLDKEKIKQMRTLLAIPSHEDLNYLLAAAEQLRPGTYNKVCGDPLQIAVMDKYLTKSLGVG